MPPRVQPTSSRQKLTNWLMMVAQAAPAIPRSKHEDQQRVQSDVQHRAAGDAHHGVGGAALKAQLVVQHQRCGHPRRAQQDHAEVRLGIGQNGVRGAQQVGQRLQKKQSQHADQHAGGQTR